MTFAGELHHAPALPYLHPWAQVATKMTRHQEAMLS